MANDYLRTSLDDPVITTFIRCPCAENKEMKEHKEIDNKESSTRSLVSEQSTRADVYQRIDRPLTETGVQVCRLRTAICAGWSSHEPFSSIRSILAQVVVPIMNINNAIRWGYPPSNLLNATDTLYFFVERVYERICCRLRGFNWGPVAKELFAIALDIVLIIYAFGFLIISMYEAAIIA